MLTMDGLAKAIHTCMVSQTIELFMLRIGAWHSPRKQYDLGRALVLCQGYVILVGVNITLGFATCALRNYSITLWRNQWNGSGKETFERN